MLVEYTIITIGCILITLAIGNQTIKYGGNNYFHWSSSKVFDCLCIGVAVIAKVVFLVGGCALFVWAMSGVING